MKPFHLYTLFIECNVHGWSSDVTHNEQLLNISFLFEKINQRYPKKSINKRLRHFTCINIYKQFLIFIVVPCISITLKFLSPTNAPLYYTYKMLKHIARSSPDCSYMFRSTRTIIREPMPNLAKVTILWK